jgi:excisionase family DNA binding protein
MKVERTTLHTDGAASSLPGGSPKTQSTARLIKIRQAAAYLGMSAWKLRRLVQDGKIPYIPGDGPTAPWLIDIRDLDAYIESEKIRLS